MEIISTETDQKAWWHTPVVIAVIYGLYIGGCWILTELVPSGPCTPGPGLLGLFLLPIINVIWLLRSTISSVGGGRFLPEMWVHLSVTTIWVLAMLRG